MKQYLIVRTDLNMRRGKMMAQCSHSSNAIILDNIKHHPIKWCFRSLFYGMFKRWLFKDDLSKWLNGSFTKIVLGIPKDSYGNQENVIEYLHDFAKRNGYCSSLIVDNGSTEFHGERTKTVVAIGPFDTKDTKNEDMVDILKSFKLM